MSMLVQVCPKKKRTGCVFDEHSHGIEEILDVGAWTDFVVELVEFVERPVVRLDNITLNICTGSARRKEKENK